MANKGNVHIAKRLITQYKRDSAGDLAALAEIQNDDGRTRASKEELSRPIIARRQAAFSTVHAKLKDLAASAAEGVDRNVPAVSQRAVATLTTEGAQRAAATRAMLKDVPTKELLATATAARESEDKAVAHAVRLEISARIQAGTIKTEEVGPIQAQLAFPKLVERHREAVADLVTTKVLHAEFVVGGPLCDTGTTRGSAVKRLSAFRTAATAPPMDGNEVVRFTPPQVAEMMEALGVAE